MQMLAITSTPQQCTPETRGLAPVGSRSQADLRDWANIHILYLYSFTSPQSSIVHQTKF